MAVYSTEQALEARLGTDFDSGGESEIQDPPPRSRDEESHSDAEQLHGTNATDPGSPSSNG